MDDSAKLGICAPPGHFFSGAWQHLMLLGLMIPGAYFIAAPALEGNLFLGLPDSTWFWLSLGTTVLHQVIVWLVFRAQLCCQLLTRVFGRHDTRVWAAVFLPLLLGRPLILLGLALSDTGSLVSLRPLQIALGVLLMIPAVYTFRSIYHHFGIQRALGGDHFRDRYRQMPFVHEGAFRYSSNAMYSFAFLALWAIALFAGSRAALSLALFQHAYIWVHMYCTEQPDIRLLYR
jgi:hypothetical protein